MPYKLAAEITLEQMGILSQELMEDLDYYGVNETDVLDVARKAINTWTGYFQDNITAGKRDMKFLLRDQWESNERAQFIQLAKVCLTLNTMADIVNKIIAEQRKMRPALMVRSINGIASDEDLQLRTDLLRSISYHSDNDIVYQTAFASAMQFGYGAFSIYTAYESSNSFRRVIKYDLIEDVTTCFFDPAAKMPHKGDGDYCGRLILMSLDEFKSTYPWITDPQSYQQPQILNTRLFKMKDIVVICEFYQKEWYPKIIYELSDGRVVDDEEWKEIEDEYKDIGKKMGEESLANVILMREKPHIVMTRHTQDYRIMHYRMLRDRIIEVTEWESKELPIVFVPGRSCYIDGKQYTKSFICDARDIQKFVNYLVSDIATEVKNRRREQWLGTADSIVGQEFMWRNPEVSQGMLIAKPDPKTGKMPERFPAAELPQSILGALNYAVNGIKEVLGFYDANLGKQSNEKSGVAVENRATQGNLSAFVFMDNMNQAIAQGGKVVLSLMPAIYGDKRSVVLSNAAGESRSVELNKEMPDGKIENPILHGDFDVEISAAPSFAVQKAQALEVFTKLALSDPQRILPLVADLIAKNLDVEDQHRLIKRFEKLVPPAILAEERGEEPPPQPPSPQEQMMKMQQELAQKQLEERAEELRMRHEKHELEKVKLAMDAHELQEKLKESQHRRETETHKTDLDFTAKIANIIKDLHK
jgi:hypothetical protein